MKRSEFVLAEIVKIKDELHFLLLRSAEENRKAVDELLVADCSGTVPIDDFKEPLCMNAKPSRIKSDQ